MQAEAGSSCLTLSDTLNGMSVSKRHHQPEEPGEPGRSRADATGGTDPDPGHVPVQDAMSRWELKGCLSRC